MADEAGPPDCLIFEEQQAVSGSSYLQRPRRDLLRVLWARYNRLCTAAAELCRHGMPFTPGQILELVWLEREIAAIEAELSRNDPCFTACRASPAQLCDTERSRKLKPPCGAA